MAFQPSPPLHTDLRERLEPHVNVNDKAVSSMLNRPKDLQRLGLIRYEFDVSGRNICESDVGTRLPRASLGPSLAAMARAALLATQT